MISEFIAWIIGWFTGRASNQGDVDALETRAKTDADVDRESDSAAADELRKWDRD